MAARRIAIIGLDCAPPRLVFDEYRSFLPNLSRLMEQGSYAVLESCHPPITVPAWSCLASGYDAGQLGVYGFRNRADWGYSNLTIATSTSITQPRIWDHFHSAGLYSICLGVPQTYPIARPPRGVMVSSFLTPDKNATWVWPPELAREIDAAAEGNYIIDVENFRTRDKEELLAEIQTMTRRRFAVAQHLLATQPWDLFMMVEMGTDRIHHGFWHYADPLHPRFAGPEHPLRWAIRDYYQQVDGHLGRLLEYLPDDVLVLVVSDHGAKALHGGIAVNEWLIERGYLVLDEYPSEPTPPAHLKINWPRTACWSEGGYYARLFFNVRGREPQGLIEPASYENWRNRLIDQMQALPGPQGEPLGTIAVKPESVFRSCRGIPPDLMCYWANLSWRSVGSVGHRQLYLCENDTGPDEANHDWQGILISRDPLIQGRGRIAQQNLLDVGPSLLAAAGLSVPPDTAGRPAMRWS